MADDAAPKVGRRGFLKSAALGGIAAAATPAIGAAQTTSGAGAPGNTFMGPHEDVADIYAYLQTIPKAKIVADIPALAGIQP